VEQLPDVSGSYRLEPTRRPGFPWAQLVGPEGVVASVGRFSAFNTFLLRGQWIVVGDRKWRMKSVGWYRMVVPKLVDGDRRKLAVAAAGPDNYAITCRDRGFTLIPAEERPGRARVWELLEFEEPLAMVRRNPYEATIASPIPLPALLMSFTLATLGIMGEKDLVETSTAWAAPQQ
jgi:hypothetical protein